MRTHDDVGAAQGPVPRLIAERVAMDLFRLIVTLLLTIGTISPLAGQTPQSPDSAQLVRLEHVWNEAHRRGDTESLDLL